MSGWAVAHPLDWNRHLCLLMTPTGHFLPGRAFSLREAEEFARDQGWRLSIAFKAPAL